MPKLSLHYFSLKKGLGKNACSKNKVLELYANAVQQKQDKPETKMHSKSSKRKIYTVKKCLVIVIVTAISQF
jgi:hypothetical protein